MRAEAIVAEESVGRVGRARRVVIARDMLDTLKLREGDLVAFSKQRNGVLIRPKPKVDPDDVLTLAEARKVRHALKQIREGKTKPWAQIKNELGL